MKINAEQLSNQLAKSIAPYYLITGEEPLLIQEAVDHIRQYLTKQAYTERQSIYPETGFNWQDLNDQSQNLSLFSEKKLIELHFTQAKMSKDAIAFLDSYCEINHEDQCLLITMGKLEATQTKSNWYNIIEKNGLIVQVWPIKTEQLPAFLQKRLQKLNFEITSDALQYLAANIEGNLLAAKQVLERIQLLFNPKKLNMDDLQQVITQSAQYDVFQLANSALAGNTQRCMAILSQLKLEDSEITLALWSVTKEIRALIKLFFNEKVAIWDSQRALYQQAQRRLNKTQLHALLQQAARIDQMIKGEISGNAWQELELLCITFSGEKNYALTA